MQQLQSEVRHEPPAALYGGEDGLQFYRAILKNWQSLLTSRGFLLFEIGYDQAEALCALAREYQKAATVYKDYGGNDRVVLIR
jgi:release factor glutamine methyltransferase